MFNLYSCHTVCTNCQILHHARITRCYLVDDHIIGVCFMQFHETVSFSKFHFTWTCSSGLVLHFPFPVTLAKRCFTKVHCESKTGWWCLSERNRYWFRVSDEGPLKVPPQMKTLPGVSKLKWTCDILAYQTGAINADGSGYTRTEAEIEKT